MEIVVVWSIDRLGTPSIKPAISIDEYQMDFAGAQTTLPSMAELLLLGLTRAVAVSVSAMSNS
jgi:hypothetical protein